MVQKLFYYYDYFRFKTLPNEEKFKCFCLHNSYLSNIIIKMVHFEKLQKDENAPWIYLPFTNNFSTIKMQDPIEKLFYCRKQIITKF